MPIVYQQDINPHTKLGLWHITEDELFFKESVLLHREIANPKKRLQHLAGRHLLKILFPDFPLQAIKIAETRKPFIDSDPFHFSISHCGAYAAAIVSKKQKVGIDVELPVEKIQRIAEKFLSEEEKLLLNKNDGIKPLTAVWSVKEAFFKWYGKGEVNFKNDMQIRKLEIANNEVFANLQFNKDVNQELCAYGRVVEGNFLIWVVS